MKIFLKLVLAVVVPILLTVALGYAQSVDSQPDTVTLDQVLQSLD